MKLVHLKFPKILMHVVSLARCNTNLQVETTLEHEAHAPQALVLCGGAERAANVLALLLHVEYGL